MMSLSVICQDVFSKSAFLEVFLSRLCTSLLIVNGTDWILHCLLNDIESFGFPPRGREEGKSH